MGTFAEKVSYLNETKLLIKDAIKNKGVAVEEDTPFREYANKIASISASADDIEPIVLTGDCRMACAGYLSGVAASILGNKISTVDLTSVQDMFSYYGHSEIPFALNFKKDYDNHYIHGIFNCSEIKIAPRINNLKTASVQNMFFSCKQLKEIPDDFIDTWDLGLLLTSSACQMHSMYASCYSLRRISPKVLSRLQSPKQTYYMYKVYYGTFKACYVLDEITGLVVDEAELTSTPFVDTFSLTNRLANMTFAMNEDGSPKTARWSNVSINLAQQSGYGHASVPGRIFNYNSGITADKEVKDNETYQALKNDPDWFSFTKDYSRYNHTSAVNTINSLPDTSAYLAEKGGKINTIKFDGSSGLLTDGGAINTLTEEEIAVATAKGWTVTWT